MGLEAFLFNLIQLCIQECKRVLFGDRRLWIMGRYSSFVQLCQSGPLSDPEQKLCE